jgi:hypothetical protein
MRQSRDAQPGAIPRELALRLSTDHFSVDGTLIEAWASMKSSKPKRGRDEPPADGRGRNGQADFHGQRRSNETHASTTDPDARLYRKGPGKEAKLCFVGHSLMENRNGLVVDVRLTPADGHAERIAALHMIEPRADWPQAITLAADKSYDAEDFINELRAMKVTPMWRRTRAGARRRSTAAQCDTPATLSVSASANGSKRPSAGSRQSPVRRKPSFEGGSASDGPSPSRLRLIIWRGDRAPTISPGHDIMRRRVRLDFGTLFLIARF